MSVIEPLVRWYRREARDLPWRRAPTPYTTLLSEIMSQQTRVETVIPYFERFVSRWPTVESLAAAEEAELMSAWAGLGYYSRARNLHAAARAVVARGGFPEDVDGLRSLPGVGPYTAGAIASIAFGVPAPAVDGNVERVMSRRLALEADVRSPAARRRLADEVAALHVGADPREVTQALMELGATVCTPRRPACARCPWAEGCVARAEGRVAHFPIKAAKAPPVAIRGASGLWFRDGRVLMGRRPPRGLLGGLWEPVGATMDAGDDPAGALIRAYRERVGVHARLGARLGAVVHVFTHRRLTVDVWEVLADDDVAPRCLDGYDDIGWFTPDDDAPGRSTLARRILVLWQAPPLGAIAAEPACPPLPWSSSETRSSPGNSPRRTRRT